MLGSQIGEKGFMDNYQQISNFLVGYFADEWYAIAIRDIRKNIRINPEDWPIIVETIRNRDLLPSQPLSLVKGTANQLLYENSDEEAYYWLDLMIRNVERTDGQIEEYYSR